MQQATIPSQIGSRYSVLEELGRGGCAIVYHVRDTARGDIALKQLDASGDSEHQRKLRALFEREYYVLAQLAHPSIVQVFDFETDASGPFYTMELLDGGDLKSRSPLPFRQCCELGVQICSALAFLHSRRYVHRDLSPRNVHFTSDGRVKLIDFGALVPMGPCRQVVGTPAFTAPESIQGTPLDARTDLFSFGATLYFALTGRPPFAVSTFEDLRAAWRGRPLAPSDIVAGIPPELDLLVMSLLRVNPEHRPRSAFEVMQRLAAIGGIANPEAGDFSQAYLHAPTLVGRDTELQRVRASTKRAIARRGGGLWLEGAPGSGRSRLLDAFVLEAKTQGLLTARAQGAAPKTPCAVAYDLAAQLLEVAPESVVTAVRQHGSLSSLLDWTGDSPRMRPFAQVAGERDKLTSFIELVAELQPVLLAVDDAEHVDDASLALLASLAHRASERALVIAASVTTPRRGASPALEIIATHSQRLRVRELTKPELTELLSSVFGAVPHVALVSERIFAISLGNPRAAMAVAQHMVDIQSIRYAEGSWHLPADLTLTELPADAEELLRARLAKLPPLARRLAELQALAIAGRFTRSDYARLAGTENAGRLDSALDTLVQCGVLSSDGDSYVLSHSGDRALLLAGLTSERSIEHHAALAHHFGPSKPGMHHLLMAGETERALDRLIIELENIPDRADVAPLFGMSEADMAASLEEAFLRAVRVGRPLRDQHAIARWLVIISVISDNKLHARYADFWRSRLELDSGLADYRSLDPSLPAADRLKQALDTAVARHLAAPERERVHRVDEAIRLLAQYVSISIAIGARTRNIELLQSIPDLLEPFAPLTPLLHALWQNAVGAYEMNFRGCIERARERALAVYEQLGQLSGNEQYFANVIRSAVASALGTIDAAYGLASAERWIQEIENDPLQSVNAMYIRRVWSIIEGNHARAQHFRTRAEILALQSSTRQMFTPPLRHELNAHVRAGDLANVKQVTEQIARLAEDAPGWKSQQHLAEGHYQRLRGDLASAQAAYERALEASIAAPQEALRDRLTWAAATAGYVGVLAARGQVSDACAIGRAALEECEALDIQGAAYDLVRELAVAEARAGEHARASERLDRLIALREGALEAYRVIDYEARIRVAIEARDSDVIRHYLERLAKHGVTGGANTAQARHAQLFEEVRGAGLTVDLAQASAKLAAMSPSPNPQLAVKSIVTALSNVNGATARAQRALALLLEAAGSGGRGWLYLAQESGLSLAASQPEPPDGELDALVRRYWLQLQDADSATVVVPRGKDASLLSSDVWTRDDERLQPIILHSSTPAGVRRIGVAVLVANDNAAFGTRAWEIAGALSTMLFELGDARGIALD